MNKLKPFSLAFAIFLIFSVVPLLVAELDVASSELKSVEAIEFTSYIGPHTRVDSLAEIIAIGTDLSENLDAEGRSDYEGKYSIQRIISSEPLQSFDADILSLSPIAGVDHVRNLRHIISGYLQAQYAYEAADADTISTYITYYNAFYRSNMEYFEQKYNPTVQNVLDPELVGLSTNYAEWPGATQIVIPLSAYSALEQEPGLDLDEAGQKSVSEYLRENEPEDARQTEENMLDLRQDELAEDQQVLDEKQGGLEGENREMREALEKNAEREPSTENKEEKQELEQGLEGNQREQSEVDAVQQAIAQRRENLNKEQRDLQELVSASPPEEVLMDGVQVELLPGKNGFFQFYAIDENLITVVRRSEINSIRSEDFVADESGYVVVAGEYDITQVPQARYRMASEYDITQVPQGGHRIRLVRLKENFDIAEQGRDDLHPDSGVWQIGDSLFAYLQKGQLGRFNLDLELVTQSKEAFMTELYPRFVSGYILVQKKKKRKAEFVLLDPVTMQGAFELK